MIGTATSVINWKYLPGTTSIVAGAFAWVCYHCQQVNGMWMNQCSACYVYKTSAAPNVPLMFNRITVRPVSKVIHVQAEPFSVDYDED